MDKNIQGIEFHPIIKNIFGDVRNYQESEQIMICCPVCAQMDGVESDGKYNLELNSQRRIGHCWKCDTSWSLGRLIRRYGTNADFDLYKSYASVYGSYDSYKEEEEYFPVIRLPKEMILFKDMDSGNLEHFEAYSYMIMERKLSREILVKHKIGFCIEGYYQKRIIVPSYDRYGDLNYFVARSYDPKEKKKKYLNPKVDKNKIIFNESNINWDSCVYIVEGVFEMLTFPINTIPLLGKTIFDLLLRKLKEHKPNIVIILDPDAFVNMLNLYFEISAIYAETLDKIKIVKLPNNDDLDEIRTKFGMQEVIKQLYSARFLKVDDYFINKDKNDRKQYRRYFTRNQNYSRQE